MKTRLFSLLLIAATALVFPVKLHSQYSTGGNALVKTVGAEGGIMLYNTYSLIGAMNDGYVVDAWNKDLVVSVLNEQIAMMNNISAQYQELLDAQYLTYEDSLFLVKMKKCSQALKDEAYSLKAYVNDETTANRDEYDDARDRAWSLVSELLGFDEAYSGDSGHRKRAKGN